MSIGHFTYNGALFRAEPGEYSWIVLLASVPSGIMVHNLLFINEFPDVEADRIGGRRTTPVIFGFGNLQQGLCGHNHCGLWYG